MTTMQMPATLTDREMQVVRLLAEGLTNPDIGERLFLSEDTIKTHIQRINRKWGVCTRQHIVAVAYRYGLLPVLTKSQASDLVAAARTVHTSLSRLDPMVTTKEPEFPKLPAEVAERLGSALYAADQLMAAINAFVRTAGEPGE